MADPLDIADCARRNLSDASLALDHVQQLDGRKENLRKLELNVKASVQKFQAWHKTWSSDGASIEASAEALWGGKGWVHINRMLEVTSTTSKDIADHLKQPPRSRWVFIYKSIQARHGSGAKMKQLEVSSTKLTRVVDELWIYSEAVFDSIHGLLSVEPSVPERDKLLHTALRSRPSSLELHLKCAKEAPHCSLEMDLLEPSVFGHITPSTPPGDSIPVFYNLINLSQSTSGSFKKMTFESVEAQSTLKPGLPGLSANVQDMEKIDLFKPDRNHSTVLIKVASRGSAQSSHMYISSKSIETVEVKSCPENLSEILGKLRSADLSTKEHLSVGSKVELAYKLIECGFFLLGTPWFSSLSSRSLLRLKNSKQDYHSFCLETQSLDLEDLLHDDPGALAETSQLFRLGVLLMEIALNKPDLHSRSDEADQEADRIAKLPLVEQSMGIQYCKATAFCLQYGSTQKPFRCSKYSGVDKSKFDDSPIWETEKYKEANFDEWQGYLSELLQLYYSQVYMRMKDLRDVDNDADYRSIKSWLAPSSNRDEDDGVR